MRDIRGDLQDRASLLEDQINTHEAEFEKLIEQLKREHDSRLEDLKAELEAVTRLMEVELRRLNSAPAAPTVQTREPVHHAVHQPAQHSAHQPPQHSAFQPPQHPVHQPPQQSAHQSQQHSALQPPQHPLHQPPQHSGRQPPQHSAHQPVQHRSQRPQSQPQTPPEQPLADFLVRKLNEVGATSRDDLRRLALQEGYFADANTADRGLHNTLLNVVKAGLIRQLPNGNFAPATMLDTIRLRRAM
jgi:hypothetical protein